MKDKLQKQYSGFIETPPLWLHELQGLQQFKAETEDPFSLLKDFPKLYLQENNLILGKKAESFFEAGIRNSERYELLGANLQIHKEKITLGEIDFLLKDLQTKKYLHVELVYKFYVFDPGFNKPLLGWIGPNRKDSLIRKVKRLQEKQLPILYEPETVEILKQLNLHPEQLEQQVCFRANLFIPKNYSLRKFENINQECIAGYWIPASEFTEETYGDAVFFTPKKPDWSIAPENNGYWLNYDQIKAELPSLFERKKSPLVWMKRGENYERFFIVWW